MHHARRYTPHYAQHIDPETGKQSKMIVVPAAQVRCVPARPCEEQPDRAPRVAHPQAMSWKDGYACYNTQDIQKIAAKNNPEHPMLVMLAHDGDNSFGGGYTYYTSCVKNLVDQAVSQGYAPTTVQQYLSDFPVPEDDIVAVRGYGCGGYPVECVSSAPLLTCANLDHVGCAQVEDGAWVNADSDFGSPQCINWNWPLLPKTIAVRCH